MLLFLHCIQIAFNMFRLHLICCLLLLPLTPIHFQHTLRQMLFFRQLGMQAYSVI
jgi:hypothetical protein